MSENKTVSPLQYVKGIGPKRAELYAKLGIIDAEGLLRHYPRSYIDCTSPKSTSDLEFGELCAVQGKVYQKTPVRILSGNRRIAKAFVSDGAVSLAIVFFNQPYAADRLNIGENYVFYGKVGGNLATKEMVNPMILTPEEARRLIPVYRLTKGLTSRQIARNVAALLPGAESYLAETLPDELRQRYQLLSLRQAISQIHNPENEEALSNARKRLVFEELLVLQLALSTVRGKKEANSCPISADLSPFVAQLPFALTGAQQKALQECLQDMGGAHNMTRLVQGDVGSGKTMVAAGCCYAAAKSGYQSALMAPTEILAMQHYETFKKVLSPLGISVALLTGSMRKKEKEAVYAGLQTGEIQMLVGTHAVLQERVAFASLGLVVTDEQHRFGVEQRKMLAVKGNRPHVLVMSATPIPRSLALVIYGDLDVSVIDELPAGRKPISTYLVDSGKRQRMYGYFKKQLDQGHQGYIVCPAVEEDLEGESPDLENVTDYAKKLAEGPFSGYRVGILHGKMRPAEKEKVMSAFSSGELDLLVATTVVEVGVDVPNAVFMAIENAERFGLSQLHQLRGRVGRGSAESICVLISDDPSELSRHRLKTLCQSQDGFALASEDLKMRGPGDFFGARQHGLPQMKIADLSGDMRVLEAAKKEAEILQPMLEAHPELPLASEVKAFTDGLSAGGLS